MEDTTSEVEMKDDRDGEHESEQDEDRSLELGIDLDLDLDLNFNFGFDGQDRPEGVQEGSTQQINSSQQESSRRKDTFPPSLSSASSTSAKTDITQLLQMDELFTAADIEVLQKSSHRRSSTKCFRCKQKRIPCSYEFPKCTSCKRDNVECYAWVRGLRKPVPRSLPLYLEARVAELEIELKKLKQHHVIDDLEERSYSITKYAATPFLESFEIAEHDNTFASFSSFYFTSSNLPAPFDTMIDNSKRGNMKTFIEEHPPVDLSTIPRNVVEIMMSNYMDIHLPQWPVISKSELTVILNKVLDNPNVAFSFEKAVVSITMAISAALITNKSEKRALSSSSALFATTISQILETTWESKMKKLQITLLIVHYAFANPYVADIWRTLRDALRLCVDMGLHKEVESEVITVLDVDDRRRIFLVCSAMLRHLSAVLRIRFPIPQPLISVEYPTIVDDSFITEKGIDYSGPKTKAAALHFYSLRLCESEICDVLWHNKEIPGTIEEWISNMDSKIENWYLKAEEFAKVNQLRFRLITKASLQIRMRRRTPRIPEPSHLSIIKLVEALSVHVDEYLNDSQRGQVSYLLMGVYYVEEAAVNLLDVMWFQHDWIFESFSLEYLDEKLKACIQLLEKFNERWPDIGASNMTGYLDDLRRKVLAKLNKPEDVSPEDIAETSSHIEHLIFPHNGKASSNPSAFDTADLSGTILDDINYADNEFTLLNQKFSEKSNWEDHFNDNNFWNLRDLFAQMGGGI